MYTNVYSSVIPIAEIDKIVNMTEFNHNCFCLNARTGPAMFK